MTIFMRSAFLCAVAILPLALFAATPQVKNVKAFQQYPWNKVCISYEVEGSIAANASSGKFPFLYITATDKTTGKTCGSVSACDSFLSGDTGEKAGLHRVIWDVSAQGLTINSASTTFKVMYVDEIYLVIDLSAGANASSYTVAYMTSPPTGNGGLGFNVGTYKTSKLVLRGIAPGTFTMGSGNQSGKVTLTKPFYIGIFEVTQKQWELVMGDNPSGCESSDYQKEPVERVSYNRIRGSSSGANWPNSSAVDSDSFLGKLRARTGINDFDLPTEAQWEYACRAGTTTKYSYGNAASGDYMWYSDNSDNTTHTVGRKQPNAWGLYDMHGHVWEWCLDWYGTLSYGIDPKGPASGSYRVLRGGGWYNDAVNCTSASRNSSTPSSVSSYYGFRLSRTLANE